MYCTKYYKPDTRQQLWKKSYSSYRSLHATNISETKDGFTIDILVPGFDKEGLELKIEKDILFVKSTKEAPETTIKYNKKEFDTLKLHKRFRLPSTIDTSTISAKAENGILSISLEKKEEAKDKAPKNITIQ